MGVSIWQDLVIDCNRPNWPHNDTSMARKSSSSKTREQIGYFERSQRPLACLALLLPLVVLYEIGTLAAQPAAAGQVTVFATGMLSRGPGAHPEGPGPRP